MSGVGNQGFADWQRFTQATASLVIDDVGVGFTSNYSSPVTYVGYASTLAVNLNTPGAPGFVTWLFDFCNDQAASNVIDTIQGTGDGTTAIFAALPILGPFLRVRAQASSFGGGETRTTIVQALTFPVASADLLRGSANTLRKSLTVASGGNLTVKLGAVAPGVITATGWCGGAGVRVEVQQQIAAGVWADILGTESTTAQVATVRGDVDIAPTRIVVTNLNAIAQDVTASVTFGA